MTQAATYTLETFVEDVRQIFATTKDPRTQAQEIARHMQELLRAPGWLEERIMLPADWHGHPLRRTEPLGSEPVDFTVTRHVYGSGQ